MFDHEKQIRTNVHQMLQDLWPENPANLKHLPQNENRQTWFEQFVAEKRQEWQHKQEQFLQYGRIADAHKEAIKLSQLDITLMALASQSETTEEP